MTKNGEQVLRLAIEKIRELPTDKFFDFACVWIGEEALMDNIQDGLECLAEGGEFDNLSPKDLDKYLGLK